MVLFDIFFFKLNTRTNIKLLVYFRFYAARKSKLKKSYSVEVVYDDIGVVERSTTINVGKLFFSNIAVDVPTKLLEPRLQDEYAIYSEIDDINRSTQIVQQPGFISDNFFAIPTEQTRPCSENLYDDVGVFFKMDNNIIANLKK